MVLQKVINDKYYCCYYYINWSKLKYEFKTQQKFFDRNHVQTECDKKAKTKKVPKLNIKKQHHSHYALE